jgi:hypothetical protein
MSGIHISPLAIPQVGMTLTRDLLVAVMTHTIDTSTSITEKELMEEVITLHRRHQAAHTIRIMMHTCGIIMARRLLQAMLILVTIRLQATVMARLPLDIHLLVIHRRITEDIRRRRMVIHHHLATHFRRYTMAMDALLPPARHAEGAPGDQLERGERRDEISGAKPMAVTQTKTTEAREKEINPLMRETVVTSMVQTFG